MLGDWRPRYRRMGGRTGLAWDACIAAGDVWLMECGDIEPVRRIHTTVPNGRFDRPPGSAMSWRQPAPWSGAQRLVRISLDDPGDMEWIEPFGTPGGGIIAPPVANGMFLSAGGGREVFYCSTTAVAHIAWT